MKNTVKRCQNEIKRLQKVIASNPNSEIIQAFGPRMIELQEHEIHILQN